MAFLSKKSENVESFRLFWNTHRAVRGIDIRAPFTRTELLLEVGIDGFEQFFRPVLLVL